MRMPVRFLTKRNSVLFGVFVVVFILFLFAMHARGDREIEVSRAQLQKEYVALENALRALADSDGMRAALDRLQTVATSGKSIAGLCHGLAHMLGHEAQKSLGFTQAIAIQNDVCGSGYFHGIIERELAEHSADYKEQLLTLCSKKDRRCFHGLGHGLMFVTDNDLPLSLSQCRRFSMPFQRIQCAEGAFMENFEADAADHPSAYLFPDDPYLTCRDQPEPEKGICSFYFVRYFLRLHLAAYDEAVSFCQTLPKASMEACIKGVGSAAMKENIFDPMSAVSVCDLVTEDSRSFCIEGLLSYMVVHYASENPVREFCAASLEPAWHRQCLPYALP